MDSAVAYILMYMSAALYCGFDAEFKERGLGAWNTTQYSILTSYNIGCRMSDCLTKALKVYDSDSGELNAEGFVTSMVAVYHLDKYGSDIIDKAKQEFTTCLPEVNQQINTNAFPKCSKFVVGASLLQSCLERNKKTSN